MRYAALGPGKRLRPFFAIETGKMFDLPDRPVLRAACALECIHAYSLVHDDLPAMDDDDVRRGRPTVHKQYDEATAILAGDAPFPGHKKGAVYRLPTEAEWEYVARMRGLATGDYAHGNTDANLGDYAWYSGNSGSKTHPVGLKKPIMVGGKPIYDIHGNVWEWIADWYGNNLPGSTDPQGPAQGSYRVIRGGSWDNGAQGLRSGDRYYGGPGDRYSNLGFRLVRAGP
jgi:formylglycine-generating enzyme required for sulfatase activity